MLVEKLKAAVEEVYKTGEWGILVSFCEDLTSDPNVKYDTSSISNLLDIIYAINEYTEIIGKYKLLHDDGGCQFKRHFLLLDVVDDLGL